MPSAPRDDNRVTSLVAKSDADNSPVVLEADPVTKRLKVQIAGGGGGGSAGAQYNDGDTAPANPTGTQPVYTDQNGKSAAVSVSKPLPVDSAANDNVQAGTISAPDTGSANTSGQGGQLLWTGTPTPSSFVNLTFPILNGLPESQSNVVIFISGTFTGTYVLERSPDNGATWTSFNCFIAGTADLINTGTLPGMFHGNVAGTTNVRVRATALTSGAISVRLTSGIGTGTITVGNPIRLYDAASKVAATIKPSGTIPVGADPAIVVSTSPNSAGDKITDGTNVVNIISNDTGYNGMPLNNATKTIPFSTSTAGAQTLINDVDTRGYATIRVVYTNVGTGLALTGSFAMAAPGGTYFGAQTWLQPNSPFTAIGALGVAVNTIYESPTHGDYFRMVISALTSGTVSGFIVLSALPHVTNNQTISYNSGQSLTVNQGGTWNVGASTPTGSAVPANAFYFGLNNGTNLVGAKDVNAASDANSGLGVLATNLQPYNGTTYDKYRNNTTGAAIAAGTTTTQTGITLNTYNAKRLMLLANITGGTGSIVIAVNAVSASGYSTNMLTSASLTGAGTTALRIFDGASPSANLVANETLPRTVSITVTVTGTITYGLDWILGV